MASWPRVHGRAEVDPRAPKPFGICDFCGIQYNLEDLSPQLRYAGRGLINSQLLNCRRCKDIPAPFVVPVILPPDPDPIMNARPEAYTIDEQGPTQTLSAFMTSADATLPVFYLDLYDGDPLGSGESVLETLTGSATRTNFAASMGAPAAGRSANTAALSLVSEAEASASVVYLAAFDAASDGNLIASGAVGAPPQTVVLGNGLSIDAGALIVELQGA
jgi:hypothetical protein